ncbi:PQQ-dependent sugar dehydrogenase [Galbitalea sp. SE-J8]|uniref:PQQ-dependent sugar dehydrogenase n=1 Tax=Galbitalea sp. SE-J8 TaxID=3054952 RepID=UPI00259D280B|nr:PQQ-dependent sugar dehydrogenase [Galbitalea sp. SE-J8]MDM4761558.1 PQQ-dependent sugar dehydrogenase [Galbitalea sp. SE-J8]
MRALLIPVLLSVGALVGCSSATPAPATPTSPTPPAPAAPPLTPTDATRDLASGLAAPWSVLSMPDGGALVSERDSGRILELDLAGGSRLVGTVPGVAHAGEGGLLGLAPAPAGGELYAYLTTASDNRIVRMPLGGPAGGRTIGAPVVVLDGLARAANHDGGRIAFGPDGMLYATVGDAGDPSRAQDVGSLNGKILRMTPDGAVPADNPFPGSLVYSLGHRNPQGIAWDADGRLYAAEFGQDTWDEFNRIEPGRNYGWPEAEGIAHDPRFVDPLVQWATDDASPSGLTRIGGTFFLAGLGGERLWTITIDGDGGATADDSFVGELGRLRDAVAAPDGSLWLLTNNTDGRGDPRDGDDRLVRVELGAAS